MKYLRFSIFLMALIFIAASCKKSNNGPENKFSFNGKSYAITGDPKMIREVLGSGTASEIDIHQMVFYSKSGNDTTMLMLAAVDTSTKDLNGTYNSLDAISNAGRGVFPFLFIAASGLIKPDKTNYFTGPGGTLEVSKSGDKWTIKFNNISAGNYGDMLDSDPEDGNTEYAEVSKISGSFTGTIIESTNILSSIRNLPIGGENIRILNLK